MALEQKSPALRDDMYASHGVTTQKSSRLTFCLTYVMDEVEYIITENLYKREILYSPWVKNYTIYLLVGKIYTIQTSSGD